MVRNLVDVFLFTKSGNVFYKSTDGFMYFIRSVCMCQCDKLHMCRDATYTYICNNHGESFKTFSSAIGEIFILCNVTYKLVENLEKPFEYGQHFKILYVIL